MSHYDCTNCGKWMGLFFGSCSRCTPQRYFEVQRELADIYNELHRHYEAKMKAKIEKKLAKHPEYQKLLEEKKKMEANPRAYIPK